MQIYINKEICLIWFFFLTLQEMFRSLSEEVMCFFFFCTVEFFQILFIVRNLDQYNYMSYSNDMFTAQQTNKGYVSWN